VVCFYLGFFSLSRSTALWPFWSGIFVALLLVLATGLEQHFGGLKESKQYFMTYVYPKLHEVPPGYLKKLGSDRIFATFFYPNALAGGLLLLLPPTAALLWKTRRFTEGARLFLIGIVAAAALACLFWSGSKGGWLLALVLGVVALLRLGIPVKYKALIVGALVLAGTAGFIAKYASFFRKGATSVVARFDYWQAAVRIAAEHPVLGTGPGTFYIPYEKIKRPESEPSRLVHNDYLQQASDSGLIGAFFYAIFVVTAMIFCAKHADFRTDWVVFSLWLGVLGFCLESLVEFSLYIPALAWPAFAFLGWLLAGTPQPKDRQLGNRVDQSPSAA